MVEAEIIQLKVGYANPVLIRQEERMVLVDTGPYGRMNEFTEQISNLGIDPGKISLIILTHTHYDHTGNLAALKQLTGAKVVVNEREADWLSKGLMPIPRGTNIWTRLLVGAGDILMPGYASPRPYDADIFVDERLELNPWGVNAEIIHTPGHTRGSQSVVVGRNLVCGDLFFNYWLATYYPPFADDERLLLRTWKRIFDMGIERIYPGHGQSFSANDAREAFYRRLKRAGLNIA